MPEPLFYKLSILKQKRIVEAAQAEFAHKGYIAGSTNQVVKTCGIAKGSLFKYFKDKNDLYLYCLSQAHRCLFERMQEANVPDGPLVERFACWAKVCFSVLKTHPNIYLLFQNFAQAPLALQQRYQQDNTDFFNAAHQRFFSVSEADVSEADQDLMQVLMWCHSGLSQEIQSLFMLTEMSIEELEHFFNQRLAILCKIFSGEGAQV